tara:strand:- start:151 stop:405 length:255 start_codon:yes stop_codon:yes gene_type:complete
MSMGWKDEVKVTLEEEQLGELMDECLAVFEGGEIREEYDTAWVNFVIEEMVDSFYRIKKLIARRKDGRKVVAEMFKIIGKDSEE